MERTPLPASKHAGVYAFPGRGGFKWQSTTIIDGQRVHMGTFASEAAAALAVGKTSKKSVPQSRFKGVYFVLGGRWEAKITYKSKSKHIGTFDSEEDAARAFDFHARSLGVPERCNYDDYGNEVVQSGAEPFRGVRRSRSKWRAVISVHGKSVDLGMYDTKEEAADVVRSAEKKDRKRTAPTVLVPPRRYPAQQGQWFSRLNALGESEYLFAPSYGETPSEQQEQQPYNFAEDPGYQASWGIVPPQQPNFDNMQRYHHP